MNEYHKIQSMFMRLTESQYAAKKAGKKILRGGRDPLREGLLVKKMRLPSPQQLPVDERSDQ
jgi:hypothetical protein